MSLLLNGAKTMTIAGTEMQCLEIYTGEAYTLPLEFTDNSGNSIDASGWTLASSAKFYTVDNITYADDNESVVLGNLTLNAVQPANTAYTLQAAFSNASVGLGYLYLGADITNSGNDTPNITLANSAANSTLVIVTLQITKQSSANASLNDVSREPLGFVVRYQ
jgi:hypothetical protein